MWSKTADKRKRHFFGFCFLFFILFCYFFSTSNPHHRWLETQTWNQSHPRERPRLFVPLSRVFITLSHESCELRTFWKMKIHWMDLNSPFKARNFSYLIFVKAKILEWDLPIEANLTIKKKNREFVNINSGSVCHAIYKTESKSIDCMKPRT